MKTIIDNAIRDSSFSFSKRYFHWKNEDESEDESPTFAAVADNFCEKKEKKEKHSAISVSKLRSALTYLSKNMIPQRSNSGSKFIGTIFGYKQGYLHFCFQEEPKMNPMFLIELATPTSVLVREMASGLVRIALETEKKPEKPKGFAYLKLLEERQWRTYCNGKSYGYAMRRECGEEDSKVLKALEPITMGAGVLPVEAKNGEGPSFEREVLYMRAKFERVVGSRDSEAFYMMNVDGSYGPELCIYLLRV